MCPLNINKPSEPSTRSYTLHLEVPLVRLMGTAPVEHPWAVAAACEEDIARGDGSVTSNPWNVNCRECKRTTAYHRLTRYEARA